MGTMRDVPDGTWEEVSDMGDRDDATEAGGLSIGRPSVTSVFDVRIVGSKSLLRVVVGREGDVSSSPLVCELLLHSPAAGSNGTDSPLGHVTAGEFEGAADAVASFVSEAGRKVKNRTALRYDMESAVEHVDRALADESGLDVPTPRDSLLAESAWQVDQMMEELPIDAGSRVERMMLDTFRQAVRNVIAAAYDAGYRDGSDGRESVGVAFDYDAAIEDGDLGLLGL